MAMMTQRIKFFAISFKAEHLDQVGLVTATVRKFAGRQHTTAPGYELADRLHDYVAEKLWVFGFEPYQTGCAKSEDNYRSPLLGTL